MPRGIRHTGAGKRDIRHAGLGLLAEVEAGGRRLILAKPEKVKASGVSLAIDGVITRRVQRLSIGGDFPQEQISELANAGVVQYISDAPEFSIQIDTNDVGSVDTMAMICDALIPYTVSTVNADRRGGALRSYIRSTSSNDVTIDQNDMLNGYCSLLVSLDDDGTSAERAMWVNHCGVTGVNLAYDVDGNFAENFTLAADNKTWFHHTAANVRMYKPLLMQMSANPVGNGAVFQHLSNADTSSPAGVPNGATVYAIGVNNEILYTQHLSGVTQNCTVWPLQNGRFAASAAGVLSTPWFSVAANSTDRCWIIYKHSDTATWEATSDANSPGWELEASAGAVGALRRGYMTAYLWNSNTDSKSTYTAAGRALRLQSVSIDVALGEDKLYELGTDGFYGISKQTPVPVTVTISALESDLEYFAALVSTSHANTDVLGMTVSDFNGYNKVRIELYKDKAKTAANKLKIIEIEKMYVQSENFDVSVGGNATQEITFSCDNVSIAGQGVSITGGGNWAN